MISRDTYIELTKFGIVGSLCFGLDLVLYYTLTEYFGAPTYLGKSISVISATFLNYYLNKTWTWGQSNRDSKRFAKYLALYVVSGLLNVVSNEIFFNIFPKNEFQMLIIDPQALLQKPFLTIKLNKLFAVIGATVVGMVVNYIGQKLWVFKEETPTDK
ncbi:MAG: GtrA family protein [Bacteroidia bacterium]|nr:GtrA family protein [Bacteroidia bacterium]